MDADDTGDLSNGVFAPRRPVAGPLRFFDLGSHSIVEWSNPDETQATRNFRSLEGVRQAVGTQPGLSPALFIFHCGRCGSTLLGRLLETDSASRVFLEPNALLQFFELKRDAREHPDTLADLRILIDSYGLHPQTGERRTVFKLSSQAVEWAEALRHVFPDSDFVYLLREPAEVIASNVRRLPRFLGEEDRESLSRAWGGVTRPLASYSTAEWCAWYIDHNLRAAWKQRHLFRRVIDYRDFRVEYPRVLNLFRDPHPLPDDDPTFAAIMSADTKRPGRSYSPEVDSRKATSEIRATAEGAARESYARWQTFTGTG